MVQAGDRREASDRRMAARMGGRPVRASRQPTWGERVCVQGGDRVRQHWFGQWQWRWQHRAAAVAALVGGDGGDVARGGGGDDSDGGWIPSSIFLEQFTPFFLQMMARVCGGRRSLPLL